MSFYFRKTPKILASFYKSYTWYHKTEKKEVCLTFDDGPTPKVTEFVLDILKEYQVKATFFCLGKNIEKYPELFNRIIKEGHTVGNHTQNHLNGWKTNTGEYITNVEKCQKIINSKTIDTTTKLFRPPYGRIKMKQAKQLLSRGYKIIMWSVLSADFDIKITKEKCLENVIKNTKGGDIIVFHDSEKAFERLEYTLPKTLEFLKEKDFLVKKM